MTTSIISTETKYMDWWDEALEWARSIEKVWTGKMEVEEFLNMLRDVIYWEIANDVRADPDRPSNLIVNGRRFSSILHGSNSLWAYLTDTDFDLDEDTIIPSEYYINLVEDEIKRIRIRLLTV